MIGTLSRQLRSPRFSRALTQQILAEPMGWNQAPVVITTLPNGVRVATKEGFGEVATIGVHLDAGVRSETRDTAGAAHLLEQLNLAGTKKRPRAALEAEVEGLGAALSVSSGREQSSYSITLGKGDIKQAVDILSDMVVNTGISNLEKERQNILRNLEELEQPTRAVIDDRLHTCAFRDYSLGFSTIGPFDGIEKLTQAHLEQYVAANFSADKTVLVAAGPVKHADIVALASAAFGGLKSGPAHQVHTKPYFCGAELQYRNDEMGPTAYIAIGWEGVPWRSPDAVTFMVMQHIIGSYKKDQGLVPGTISGNRVINAIANKMGVGCADEYECFNINYRDTGMFGFYVVCDEIAVEHATGELMFGINLLAFSVTDEEVERGKRELKAAIVSSTGSSAANAAEVGKQVLGYGRGIPPAEFLLRIDAIDAEEIKRVAYKYLNDAELAVTGLGPLHGMPQYYDLRRATNMHRY